ncbi:MAG: LuxR C-terminal-related transcriptional regulator [Myxococcota bacterium]
MVWLAVGPALLAQIPEPALVLDGASNIFAANDPLLRLLNSSKEALLGRQFEAICGDPLAARALAQARRDGSAFVQCTVRVGERQLRVSMELTAHQSEGAVLSRVSAWHVETEAGALRTGLADLSYEISCHGRDFGIVRHASSRIPQHSVEGVVGRVCFEAFAHSEQPCVGCPARAIADQPSAGRQLGIVKDFTQHGACRIASAERIDETSVRVDTLTADDAMITSLVQARVDRLCHAAGISLREREVLNLLILGRSISDAAKALEISPRTVKFHQARIFKKLGADSRFDLMRLIA